MGQSDPTLTYLKKYGYSVIRLPKDDITPSLLLAKEGKSLTRLGALTDLFKEGASPAPVVARDGQAANLDGGVTANLSVGLGVSVLGNFIKAMGGSNVGLEAQYQNAKAVEFKFDDIKSDTIEIIALDKFLTGAEVDNTSRHVAELLEADQLYVLTATLKCKAFSVKAEGSSGGGVELDVSAIQGAVGGKVKVAAASAGKSMVTYRGDKPLVFGFQAVQLFYNQGRYQAFKSTDPGSGPVMAVRGGGKKKSTKKGAKGVKKPRTYLSAEGAFLKLD